MIAKIIKGTSFSGVLAYILGKQEGKARILYAEGVRANAQFLCLRYQKRMVLSKN
ncbi:MULTISPECIES: hypothetical protein [Porphyromonas]|uniref:hypothetical protein n=1 Tax=Porphyromonas TaxID=836 RepID=UPI000A8914C5|nr:MULTISPECIES: hypothetical protein [Porphyromonas]